MYKIIEQPDLITNFSKFGLYKINGSNGCGKTTLINNLLKNLDNNNNNDLVAYLPQERYIYEIDGNKLLNCVVDKTKLEELITYFNIDYINKPIKSMSGGELTKLLIVRTFALDRPIIVLDEPTNYLDDLTLSLFIDLLNKEKMNKSIVLISHDERLNLEYDSIYEIKNFELFCNQENINQNNVLDKKQNNKIKELSFISVFFSNFNYLLLIMLVVLNMIVVNTIIRQVYDISISNYFKQDNYFELLDMSNCLNEKDISQDCEKIEPLTLLDNIKNNESIDKVFYYDNTYNWYSEYDKDEDGRIDIEAVPNILALNEPQRWENCSTESLVSGNVPKDGKKEVMISMKQLYSRYNIKSANPIGESIKINGDSFKIVGISNEKTICVSYDKNKTYGIKEYTSDDKKTVIDIVRNLEKNGYLRYINSVYVISKSNKESINNVTRTLLNYEPMYQISSNTVFHKEEFNNFVDTLKDIILLILSIAVAFSFILNIFGNNAYTFLSNRVNDNNSLSFEFRKNKNKIIISTILGILLSLFTTAVAVQFTYESFTTTKYMVIFNSIIIFCCLLFYYAERSIELSDKLRSKQ